MDFIWIALDIVNWSLTLSKWRLQVKIDGSETVFVIAQRTMRRFHIKQLISIKKKLGVKSIIVASPLRVKKNQAII